MDSKIALLINRDVVDPTHYGGKKTEECVFSCIDTLFLTFFQRTNETH